MLRSAEWCEVVMGTWGFLEGLVVSLLRVSLALLFTILILRLMAGASPSWELIDQTLRRLDECIYAVARIASLDGATSGAGRSN
jgi:hypothetical protein